MEKEKTKVKVEVKMHKKERKLDNSQFAGVDWSSSARYIPYSAGMTKRDVRSREPDSEFSKRRKRDGKSGSGDIITTNIVSDDDAVVILPGEAVVMLPPDTTPDSLGSSTPITHAWIGLTQKAPEEWKTAFDDVELPTETLSGGNFPFRDYIGPFIRDCAKGAALALVSVMDVATPSTEVTCAPMARGVGEHGSIGYAISVKIRAKFPSDMDSRLLYTSHTNWLTHQLEEVHGVTDFSVSFAFHQEESSVTITIHCIVPVYIGRRIGLKETDTDTWAASAEEGGSADPSEDESCVNNTAGLPIETPSEPVVDVRDLNRRAGRLWKRYRRKGQAGNPAYDFFRCVVSGSIEDILCLQHMEDTNLSTPSEQFVCEVVDYIIDWTSIRVDLNDSIGIVWRGCDSITSRDITTITNNLSKLGIVCSIRLQVYGSSTAATNVTLMPAALVVANASYVRSLVNKSN